MAEGCREVLPDGKDDRIAPCEKYEALGQVARYGSGTVIGYGSLCRVTPTEPAGVRTFSRPHPGRSPTKLAVRIKLAKTKVTEVYRGAGKFLARAGSIGPDTMTLIYFLSHRGILPATGPGS